VPVGAAFVVAVVVVVAVARAAGVVVAPAVRVDVGPDGLPGTPTTPGTPATTVVVVRPVVALDFAALPDPHPASKTAGSTRAGASIEIRLITPRSTLESTVPGRFCLTQCPDPAWTRE
jgi:hypothetical protein